MHKASTHVNKPHNPELKCPAITCDLRTLQSFVFALPEVSLHASSCNPFYTCQQLEGPQPSPAFIITDNLVKEHTSSLDNYHINGLYGNRMICEQWKEAEAEQKGQELELFKRTSA